MGDENSPVVVAFDGSPEALEAVRTACALFPDRHLLVVSVWEPSLAMTGAMVPGADIGGATYMPPTPEQVKAIDDEQERHAHATAGAGVQLAVELGADAEGVPVADDADIGATVAALAEERDAAAVVVGSRGRGRVKSALLGSTSNRLLHETRRPLLVVRAPE
jgi:nucleotide-binding universal stress UspA family protein